VRENQVRRETLELFELVLDFGPDIGKIAVFELPNIHSPYGGLTGTFQEQRGRAFGFSNPLGTRSERDPSDLQASILLGQSQDRTAATDLDVIAVSSQAKHPERIVVREVEPDLKHSNRLDVKAPETR
jgi:hypothetical protein